MNISWLNLSWLSGAQPQALTQSKRLLSLSPLRFPDRWVPQVHKVSPIKLPAGSPHLETFPVAGDRYNIGWDRAWKDFDSHNKHNADFYTGKGPNGHDNGHLGIDIFGPKGTPIVAPVSGRVVRIGRNEGRGGNNVTIEKGGLSYYMAHLDTVASDLKVGQMVSAGTPVGTLGNTGASTAPHLHFSIYKGTYGNSINPFASLMDAHTRGQNAKRGPVLQNRELTPQLTAKATDLLKQLAGQPLGTEVPFTLHNRRFVARLETHGANGHIPRPHRGITLYHAAP